MGKIIPVILCGGSGRRLWPLSKADMPKQFLNLTDPQTSLFQKTVERAVYLTGASMNETVIVTKKQYTELVKSHLGHSCPHILAETAPRNTGPAIARAAIYISREFSMDATMLVMPSDHYIADLEPLKNALTIAIKEAANERISLFGVTPHRPETGYGYIQTRRNEPFTVEAFIEKPDAATAAKFIKSENYLWNSGIFVFKVSTILEAFQTLAPEIMDHVGSDKEIDPVSFDKAVLEKFPDLSVIPCDMKWMDVGTWEGLMEIIKDKPDYRYVEKLHSSGN